METKSVFRNTIYKFILSIFSIIVPVLVAPYINGLLDKQDFGYYNSSASILSFFLIFASFGIYNYGVREISKVRDNPQQLSALFTNLFLFGLITNLIVTIIYMLYVFFGVSADRQLIFGMMTIQIIGNLFMVEWVNEAIENFSFITKKTIIVRIISTVLMFIVVTKPEHTYIYALLTSVTVLVNNFASFIYIKQKIPFSFSKVRLSKYIKPLFLLLIISNANILFTQFDRLMLAQFVGPVETTLYTLPSNLINMVALTMMSLITVSIPRLNYYVSQGDMNAYQDLLDKSSRSYFMLIMPSCVGLFCLSYEVTMLYATAKYIDAYPVMQMFAIRFIYTSVSTIYTNQILYIFQKEKQLVGMLFLGGGLNVIFNFILLWTGHFTPVTAIASTGIAEIIMLGVMRRYIKRKLNITFDIFKLKNMKYFYLSIPFISIVYFIKIFDLGIIMTCLVSVCVCCVYYFGVLLLTKDQMLLYYIKKVFGKLRKKKKE